MPIPSHIDIAFEVNPEVSDGEVARVRQSGYTERGAAESVANVAPVWFANLHVVGT
jgi:hypothetical protein